MPVVTREPWRGLPDAAIRARVAAACIVHSRLMPARRGHQVIGLLLGEQLVGIYNITTGKQVN